MKTEDFITKKFNLALNDQTGEPIEIPNVGRDDLAKMLSELGFKTGVEIGVAVGEYSEILAKSNPQMKLYGVDPYTPYRQYTDYVRTSTFRNLRETAEERLAEYPNYEFIYEFSADALKRFEDGQLDFVYIDANHKEPFVTQDITEWSKKVRTGGIVAGHDFMDAKDASANWAARDASINYTKEHKIRLFILGQEGKIPRLTRDDVRSWMWVKPE